MPILRHSGFTLHYQVMGHGPEVVLLHGLTGNLAFWYPTIASRLAADYRVILLDLRGHGYSGTPSTGYTTSAMATDLEILLDHLSVERAHLIGHSYGGAVALNFATLHPRRVASLILADSRIRSLQPTRGIQNSAHWQMIREQMAIIGIALNENNEDLDFALLEQLAKRRLQDPLENFTLPPFYVPFLSGSSRSAEQWLRLIQETTALEDFKEIAGLTPEAIRNTVQPVLAVYGELSHCLATQRALSEILPDCTAVTVDGVGHFHPLVRPEIFLEQACRFLKRVELQEPASISSRESLYAGKVPPDNRRIQRPI
jgi:pimeloyl-ACP methyl ester carboxylesterase